MDCPGCGKIIRDGAKFCPSCGYSVKDTKKETEVRAKKTGDEKAKTTAAPVPRVKIEDSKPDIAKQEIEYRGYIEEKKTDSEMVIEEPLEEVEKRQTGPRRRFEPTPITPAGVKIVSILTAITGVIYVFNASLSIPVMPTIFATTTTTTVVWGVIAVLLLIFGLMFIWMAVGLWKMQRSTLNRYLWLFLINFILIIAHIFLYWYGWGWAVWPKFTDYLMFYIQATPWLIFNWLAGWAVFFYLSAIRNVFTDKQDVKSTIFR